MAWFTKNYSKFYPSGKIYRYTTPERVSPEIARQRAVSSALAKNLKLQERVQRETRERLSRGLKNRQSVRQFLNEDLQTKGPKASSTTRRPISPLLTALKPEASGAPQPREGWKKAKPSGADRRQYDPTKNEFARTLYGAFADVGLQFRSIAQGVNRASWKVHAGWVPRFVNPNAVVPCIQRHVRREIMFAKKKAGRGYRVKHRRNAFSGVPC